MSENKMTFEALHERMLKAPFHRWLGLELKELNDDGIKVAVKWREEFVVNAERGYTHGGILATVIDIAADYALAAKLGRPVPTIDIRVDYHRPAKGNLIVEARPIRLGAAFCTAEAEVYDESEKLVASGRGVYASGN